MYVHVRISSLHTRASADVSQCFKHYEKSLQVHSSNKVSYVIALHEKVLFMYVCMYMYNLNTQV